MSNNAKGSKKVLIIVVVAFIACLILILLPSSVFEKKSDTIPTLSGGATVASKEESGRLDKDYSSGDVERTLSSLTTAVPYTLSEEERSALEEEDKLTVPDDVREFIENLDPARIDMSWVVDLEYKRMDADYILRYGEKNGFRGLVDVISEDSKLTTPKWMGVHDAVFLGYVGGENKGFAAFSIDLSAGLNENILIIKMNLAEGYAIGDKVNLVFTTNNSRLLVIDGNRLIIGV